MKFVNGHQKLRIHCNAIPKADPLHIETLTNVYQTVDFDYIEEEELGSVNKFTVNMVRITNVYDSLISIYCQF